MVVVVETETTLKVKFLVQEAVNVSNDVIYGKISNIYRKQNAWIL